jgi:hypothetical protein
MPRGLHGVPPDGCARSAARDRRSLDLVLCRLSVSCVTLVRDSDLSDDPRDRRQPNAALQLWMNMSTGTRLLCARDPSLELA